MFQIHAKIFSFSFFVCHNVISSFIFILIINSKHFETNKKNTISIRFFFFFFVACRRNVKPFKFTKSYSNQPKRNKKSISMCIIRAHKLHSSNKMMKKRKKEKNLYMNIIQHEKTLFVFCFFFSNSEAPLNFIYGIHFFFIDEINLSLVLLISFHFSIFKRQIVANHIKYSLQIHRQLLSS